MRSVSEADNRTRKQTVHLLRYQIGEEISHNDCRIHVQWNNMMTTTAKVCSCIIDCGPQPNI